MLLTSDDQAKQRILHSLALQATDHPLHILLRAVAGPAGSRMIPVMAPTAATSSIHRNRRISAANTAVLLASKILPEPIDDSQCPAGTQDATEQLEAASAHARQMAREPFEATADYLQPVSWAGFEDLSMARPDYPAHTENVPYYTQVFLTGVDPGGRSLPLPIGADRPKSAPSATDVTRKMPSVAPGLLEDKSADTLIALAAAAGDAHAAGEYMRPNKRQTTEQSRAVMAIDTLQEHEQHIRMWRTKINVHGLELSSMRRRLSHVRTFVWFWLGSRGVSPYRFILNQWEHLPIYVRRWEEEMWTDLICWYASGVGSAQSVENFHSDVKEFLKDFLNITVPDMQLLTRTKRLVRLYFSKQQLQARLRPALPTHMFLYLVHCATRQRDDVLLPIDVRIAASSCLLCISGSRQSHMRIGNIAVGEKFDPTATPQPFWTLLSVSVLITLKPGENAYAMPPRIKTAGHVSREAYPWLFEPVAWNFVHNLHRHFELLNVPAEDWGVHPLIVLNAAGRSMPPGFVYSWMLKNLALEFPEEAKLYKLGTHCVRIGAQTVSKAIGVSTNVRARQGQWSSAAALMDGNNGHEMAQLYGRSVREVLVEVQRYMSTAVFQTCESAGIQFKGHEEAPPSLIQSEAAVNDALAVRHKYLTWATRVREIAPAVVDVQEDDEVLEDMEDRFDASSTISVQNFMEDAGFQIPEAVLDQEHTSEQAQQQRHVAGQHKIDNFFKHRVLSESDDEAEHDWEYHASWTRDTEATTQQSRCITPADDDSTDVSNSSWVNSVLAKMITGRGDRSNPLAELSPAAQEMRAHAETVLNDLSLSNAEISLPVQRRNGAALQDRMQPTRS